MAELELAEDFRFEPVEMVHNISTTRQLGRFVGGSLLYALSSSERQSYYNPYADPPDWSAVLKTPGGHLKLERNRWLGPTIGLMYPDAAHPLSSDLLADIFSAEPGQIHNTFSRYVDGKFEDYTRQTGSYKLPETDENGRHYWLELDQSRIRDMDAGRRLEQIAVLDGKIGELILVRKGSHNIGLHRSYMTPYHEEKPAEATPEAVRLLSDKFKKLTLEVANQLGGATQITAPYEQGKLRPYNETTAYNIVSRWALHGYSVSQGERKPGEHADPGYDILKGTKRTSRGEDTIFAEAGLSTFYYTRGAKQWRFTRGIVLKHAATVEDLELFLPES